MDWIETTTGNRISRKSQLFGAERVLIKGNSTICDEVLLKGDVVLPENSQYAITIGKYCYVDKGAQITPPLLPANTEGTHSPLKIGSYVIIGQNSEVNSAVIGNRVIIEKNCKLGDLSVIYDCCIIEEGAEIPPKTIVPPFSKVSGRPGSKFAINPINNAYKRSIEISCKEAQVIGI